jgi:hypothetical protein
MNDETIEKPLPTHDNATRKDENKHHALSGNLTHNLSVQAIKAYASDHAATGNDLIEQQG